MKKGTSFEYVAENRLFSGSDGYTLTITFPLNDCPQNIAIFGHINRADVATQKIIFDCEIRDKGFYKFGSITITEISESEVKTQFLEGRSEQNFDDTFDDIYINELDLGSASGANDSTPSNAWNPSLNQMKCVALPWVNDYSGNIQNLADYIVDDATQKKGHYQWNSECRGRSWQPYLLYITKKICEVVGYSFDFSKWEDKEEYKYLLICNTLPYAWDTGGFARALPHWSVAEYFEKLELFLGGEFTIDHRARSVNFAFTSDTLASLPAVQLSNVVDEHTAEVTVEDDKCEYQEAKNLVYKECDHEMWKCYSCDWFVKAWQHNVVRYASMSELLAANRSFRTWNGSNSRGSNMNKLLYAEDLDAYFIIRSLSKTLVEKRDGWMPNRYSYTMELRPINLFGGRIVNDSEDADEIEIEFVPAWVDETEDKYGRLLFLSFSGYDETDSTSTSIRVDPAERKKEIDATLYQPLPLQSLTAGEQTKKAEYYDRIYVGWWDGALSSDGKLPHPFVEDVEIADDWTNFRNVHFSLRINNHLLNRRRVVHAINPKVKKTFKFIADTIPNPRAVFFIKGKKYLCEKITATFTEQGMSQLLKGVFYPIAD
ncbi:MAG: hypothetical protein K2M49_00535 [Muribaculaceae bacterium]|nr:hypothetical protein [Muribaculaceae bacterium]